MRGLGYWKDGVVAYLLSDLSQSIFATLGVSNCINSLGLINNEGQRECLLLVDGMGINALEIVSKELPIFSQVKNHNQLQATFPSTTSASLTSLGTGCAVGVHGMVGYTMRVPNSGTPERLLNALKWDERVDPYIWQSEATLFERAKKQGVKVSHIAAKRYEETGFTRAALRGADYYGVNQVDEMVDQATSVLSNTRSFAYLYLNDVDDASHREGLGSEKFHYAMAKSADLILKLIENLPKGSRLWITSDHGMINRDDFVVLGKENDLLKNVEMLGGEPRVRYLYLKPGSAEETKSQWQEFFKEKVTLYTRQEAIALNLFGPEVLDKNLERIGDLIAIANGEFIMVESERQELQLSMVGHHGGITQAEIAIPLLSADI
jgi:predicted AlkP superfamily pyrophosphatase or phosphodiesterase